MTNSGKRKRWFWYLVLQLQYLVVLSVKFYVLVFYNFEKLLDVIVLLLHESLRTGGRLWLEAAEDIHSGAASITCHGASFERHKPFSIAFPFPKACLLCPLRDEFLCL